MKVLVTGATGFIGTHLVGLLRAQGHAVRCLVRPSSNRAAVQALGATCVLGDVGEPDSLSDAAHGVEVVYHLASLLKAPWRAAFHTVNVEGTRNLAAACATLADPPVLVVVSSLAAAGPSPMHTPRNELTVDAPVSTYGQVKLAAEQAASSFAPQLPLTIVRPPMVFGQRDKSVLKLFRSVTRGWHLIPGGQPAYISLIHATDLATGLVQLATHGERVHPERAGQGLYYLCDPKPIRYDVLGARLAASLDRAPPRLLNLPWWACAVAAAASELWGRLRDRPTVLNLDKLRELRAGSWTCAPSKAQEGLGFACATLQQRLNETAAWYQQEGWLEP